MSTSPRAWQDNPANISSDYKSSATRGPNKAPISLGEANASSLSQITGPGFSSANVGADDADLTRNARVNGEPLGERIIVGGRLVDERGKAIPDAVIEVWQANACGATWIVPTSMTPLWIPLFWARAVAQPTAMAVTVLHHQARRLPVG